MAPVEGTGQSMLHLRCVADTEPPPPPCPTNALSNEHFRSERIFLGPNSLGAGFRHRMNQVPNGVPNDRSCSDRIWGLSCSLDMGEGE